MVILKNIRKTNNDISSDYYPEGKSPKGFMRISIKDGTIVEHDNVSSFAAAHVKMELRRMSKRDDLPKEKRIMWY